MDGGTPHLYLIHMTSLQPIPDARSMVYRACSTNGAHREKEGKRKRREELIKRDERTVARQNDTEIPLPSLPPSPLFQYVHTSQLHTLPVMRASAQINGSTSHLLLRIDGDVLPLYLHRLSPRQWQGMQPDKARIQREKEKRRHTQDGQRFPPSLPPSIHSSQYAHFPATHPIQTSTFRNTSHLSLLSVIVVGRSPDRNIWQGIQQQKSAHTEKREGEKEKTNRVCTPSFPPSLPPLLLLFLSMHTSQLLALPMRIS